ncbi:MAG: hypothetical protein JXR70_18610 [Spirochaetales bacterium]|nr:hypothetical protein [Spirochaetales bacterium]
MLGPIDNPVDLKKALENQPDKKLLDELKKKTGLKDHELIDWIKKNMAK